MESRNGLLTLAVYLTFAMLIAVVALLGILRYGPSRPTAALPLPGAEPLPELAVAPRQVSAERPARGPTTSRGMDQQRLQLLEKMLDEKTRRLQSQTQQLDQRAAELTELQARYDEVVALVLDALSHSVESDRDQREARGSAPGQNNTPTADELAAELAIAQEAHQSFADDLAALQDGLAVAQRELLEARALRDRERADHTRELRTLEAAAASVLTRVGAESVPPLRALLNHPQPPVRRWAATMLGNLGPDAYEAVPALGETLSDNDALVRAAAQAALSAIER